VFVWCDLRCPIPDLRAVGNTDTVLRVCQDWPWGVCVVVPDTIRITPNLDRKAHRAR